MSIRLNIRFIVRTLCAVALLFHSCKQKEADPVRLQSIVPQALIDELRSRGMNIPEGNDPPKVDMEVRISPFELLDPYGPEDSYGKGHIASDYFYKFYNQTEDQQITYDYYANTVADEGTGQGAFIIGKDNRFTIFAEAAGVNNTVGYKMVVILTGMLDGKNIRDFQYAFLVTEKDGDPADVITMPVNKSRIWIDGDFVSESVSNARISDPSPVGRGSLVGKR